MITFQLGELNSMPNPKFLDGFKDPNDKQAAEALIAWANRNGLMFRPGDGTVRLVEYVVVPEAKYEQGTSGEPLLTLQQPVAKGQWDIPFGRMKGIALGDKTAKRRLFDMLNAVLPAQYQLPEKPSSSGRMAEPGVSYLIQLCTMGRSWPISAVSWP